MLCIGIGIVFIPPMVFETVSSYYPDNEILIRQIEETTNNILMVSILPALSSTLLILGLIGLGAQGVLKNKLSSMISKSQ
jgi:hypothetical protein